MKHLIEFIETEEVSRTSIFEHLKCTKEEASLVQYICKRYVAGLDEISVLEILQDNFSSEGYEYLEKLGLVKNLLDLGWMIQVSFGQVKAHEASKLELLSTSITPSISLLRLLEEGSLEIFLPEVKPYTDHLEYLQDQFDMVSLLHKIATFKQGFADNSLSIGRLKNKLTLLAKRIEERVKMTETPIVVEEFFKEKELDEKEQRIFLALLKEEYSGGEGQFRDMNTLIELISFDEYEKIKNRALLEEGSKLINEDIIDYEEILNMFGGVSRSFYLQEEVMQRIERYILLMKIDEKWKDHLHAMDQLRSGIGLRSYGQIDPKVAYKQEGYSMFSQMIESMRNDITQLVLRVEVRQEDEARMQSGLEKAEYHHDGTPAGQPEQATTTSGQQGPRKPIVNKGPKIGRNSPCPCGSGKKYKHCCGVGKA